MSNTPLSDLVQAVLQRPQEPGPRDAFYLAFCPALVGVRVDDPPPVPPGSLVDATGLEIPLFLTPEKEPVFWCCADPAEYVKRIDSSVNAFLRGRVLLELAAHLGRRKVVGILVGSSLSPHSIAIPQGMFADILAATPPVAQRRHSPWWKRW